MTQLHHSLCSHYLPVNGCCNKYTTIQKFALAQIFAGVCSDFGANFDKACRRSPAQPEFLHRK